MKALIDLITDMRNAQKEYFKTRDRDWLSASKRFERAVDNVIAAEQKDWSTELTEEILASRGWLKSGGMMVKKSTPRLGWNIADHTLIIGYADTGVKVETVGHMSAIKDTLRII